jgi:hypothetical protein
MVSHFNGNIETCSKPHVVTIEEQLDRVNHYQTWFNLGIKDSGLGDPSKEHGVKRKSLLYDLPYW